MPPQSSKDPKRDWSKYTHVPPSKSQVAKNGREVGRNLIAWNRPQMAEKLLLHMEYELIRHRVNVPWDNIAHRLNPGSSGAAVSQYLGRLRKSVLAQGHMVPPIPMKPGGPAQDPNIRGYIRSNESADDPTDTRNVMWTEAVADLKTPLGDSAWALEAMNAQEDTDGDAEMVELQPQKFAKIGSKGKRVAVEGPRSARGVAKKASHMEDDYDEDESDGIDDEYDEASYLPHPRENDAGPLMTLPPQISRFNRADSKARASTRGSLATRRGQQNNGGINTILGTVTPKRGAANNGPSLEEIMNAAVLKTPDGKHYGFTNLGGPSTSFCTADSEDADFDFRNASPTTTANMLAHLAEYNSDFVLSPTSFGHVQKTLAMSKTGATGNGFPVGTTGHTGQGFPINTTGNTGQGFPVDTTGTNMPEEWNMAADVPDVFSGHQEFEAQLANKSD